MPAPGCLFLLFLLFQQVPRTFGLTSNARIAGVAEKVPEQASRRFKLIFSMDPDRPGTVAFGLDLILNAFDVKVIAERPSGWLVSYVAYHSHNVGSINVLSDLPDSIMYNRRDATEIS